MALARAQTVLRRKAEAGRVEVVEVPPVTPDRALGQGLARAAQDLMGLALRATACREARMTLADMPEALPDHALIMLVEGPGEALGLVAIAPDLLCAAIEMLTMGRLGPRGAPPRRPTRTDASMTAELVDRFLIEIEALLAPLPDAAWALGYHYASFLEDPRPLGLLLEDIPYRVFTMELDLGTGPMRPGRMIVVLPAEGRGLLPGFRPRAASEPRGHDGSGAGGPGSGGGALDPALIPTADPSGKAATRGTGASKPDVATPTADDWPERLETTVLGLPAGIEAVLHRITLPLSAVLALKPGVDLPIPVSALENLRIEGLGGRYLARARLGQNRGFRAVRISDADAAEATLDPVPDPAALSSAPQDGTVPRGPVKKPERAISPPDTVHHALVGEGAALPALRLGA